MTNLNDWLQELHALDIQLSCENNQLRINAPKGVITDEIARKLRAQKDALIAHLVKDQTITRSGDSGPYPLSYSQQRLWFVDQLEKDSPAYNMPAAIRLLGPLDKTGLENSLNTIIARHEVLRSEFRLDKGQPVQYVHDALELSLDITDLVPLGETDRHNHLHNMIEEESQKPFHLQCAPLIRAQLLKMDEREHVLLLSMHHIVSDGWSIGLIGRELSELYKAQITQNDHQLAPLSIQYGDFARWQKDWMDGPAFKAQLDFWKTHLDGASHVLELPIKGQRPALQTYCGKTHTVYLADQTRDRLVKLARKAGATLYVPLLAAYALLLRSYTSQNDLIIGSPIANRNKSEVEDLIGFFANTLPLRINMEDDPDILQMLKILQKDVLHAFENQDIPFEKIVEALHIERDLSRSPLAQVVFILQNAPLHSSGSTSVKLEGLELHPIAFETGTVRLDMEVHVWEETDQLKIEFIYNTDLFDADAIARMADNYCAILEKLTQNPEVRISQISCLGMEEEKLLLGKWNDTAQAYPTDRCIHQYIEDHANRSPDKIALACDGDYLDYRELNARANRLAHYLVKKGVKTGERVAVCLPRSLDMIISLLAIFKTGAAYVPIDPAYPSERIDFLRKDSQAKLLITQSDLAQILLQEKESDTTACLLLDYEYNHIMQENETNLDISVKPTDLAYMIYTSGSTGRPKGVMVAHQSLMNLLFGALPQIEATSQDVWTVFHSFAFDLSVWEIWSPLFCGAKLVVVTSETTQDSQAFYKILQDEKVSVLNQTPSFMRQLIGLDQFNAPKDLPHLRLIICGGEALPRELADNILDCNLRLWNFYGPTEATVWTLIKEVKPNDPPCAIVPIGQPISNTTAYVLDEKLNILPIGSVGELHLGGDNLALGYFMREELTNERFIPNPFARNESELLYKTGDLVRRLPSGEFEYISRMDTQIKLRGFRIELGEIEQNINQLAAIAQNVVIVREDSPNDRRLCAYLVAKDDCNLPCPNEIREHLKQTLPTYMVPAHFVALDQLPLTPNGKVDHKNLPKPDETIRLVQSHATNETLNTTQQKIATIWAEELGIETVGANDNFFDLGGYSFLMVKVCHRLRLIFDCPIEVVDLFQHPSVATLAEFIEAGASDNVIAIDSLKQRASKRNRSRKSRKSNQSSEQKA